VPIQCVERVAPLVEYQPKFLAADGCPVAGSAEEAATQVPGDSSRLVAALWAAAARLQRTRATVEVALRVGPTLRPQYAFL
jgi:hypothetical protein